MLLLTFTCTSGLESLVCVLCCCVQTLCRYASPVWLYVCNLFYMVSQNFVHRPTLMHNLYYITWSLGRHRYVAPDGKIWYHACVLYLSYMVRHICQHAFIRYGWIHYLSYMVGELCWLACILYGCIYRYVICPIW